MTLRERLKKVEKDEYIYIGATSGTSWMVIATGAEAKTYCKAEDVYQKCKIKKSIKSYRKAIVSCSKSLDKAVDDLSKCGKEDIKRYKELLETIENKRLIRAEYESKILIKEQMLKAYVPILDRKVITEYEKKTDIVGAKAIMIFGTEFGRWWDLGERLRNYVEEDEEYAEEFEY